MPRAESCRGDTVMTTRAKTLHLVMVELCTGESDRGVTGVALRQSEHVTGVHTRRGHSVVTTRAGSCDRTMIETSVRKAKNSMTIIALIRTRDVSRVLALSIDTVVTNNAILDDQTVINSCVRKGDRRMTVRTRVRTRHVIHVLCDGKDIAGTSMTLTTILRRTTELRALMTLLATRNFVGSRQWKARPIMVKMFIDRNCMGGGHAPDAHDDHETNQHEPKSFTTHPGRFSKPWNPSHCDTPCF